MKYTNPRYFIGAKSDQLLKCGEHKKGRPQPPSFKNIVEVKNVPISGSSPALLLRNPRKVKRSQYSRARLDYAAKEL